MIIKLTLRGLPLLLALNFYGAAQAQGTLPPSIPKATQEERLRHQAEQEAYITADRYDLKTYPLTPTHETHWRRTLWATALREPDLPELQRALETILPFSFVTTLTETETRILEMTWQVSYQFYGRSDRWREVLKPIFQEVITWSPEPRWVALALSALAEAPDGDSAQAWVDAVELRLPDLLNRGEESDRLLLNLTLRHLRESSLPLPPIEDWFAWQIAPGEPQLFVFCERERSQLCRTFLMDAQGHWVADAPPLHLNSQPHQLWSVPLSGRSLHGLPWYIGRGETPQGVYRLEGLIPQPDTDFFYAYGFFPLVNLYAPQEAGVAHFIPGQSGTIETLAAYQKLLPPRWRSVFGLQESYWAGQLGRSLFRIHGTGEATNFFVNNDRFPDLQGWNPAIGCLSAREEYDDQGNLVWADMPKILEALQRAQTPSANPQEITGYVIVLNVADPAAIVPPLVPRSPGTIADD